MGYPYDFIPVFSSYPLNKDSNVEFYIVPFSSDCPICFRYQIEPVALQCGHIYCTECISKSLLLRKRCPVCLAFSNKYKPIKFIFKEKIIEKSFITLRKIEIKNLEQYKKYYEYPYSSNYYLEDDGSKESSFLFFEDKRKIVYQEINGSPYFLSLDNIKKLKKYPKIIQGEIISVKRRKNYSLFRNMPEEKEIFIVEL